MEISKSVAPPAIPGKSGTANGNNRNTSGLEGKEPAQSQQGVAGNPLSSDDVVKANRELFGHMQKVLLGNLDTATELRQKLRWSYWLLVVMSALMFLAGLVFVTTPLWVPILNLKLDPWNMFTAVGVGFLDFVALFLSGPIDKIKKLMGDISQLTVSFDTYQIRVAAQLLDADSTKRGSLGDASVHIGEAAQTTLDLIEKYYEKYYEGSRRK